MSSDLSPIRELLDDQLTFLLDQRDSINVVLSTPGFLRALRREAQLAIHLDDLHVEADRIGRSLHELEYDNGNPGMLIEHVWEELDDKLPRSSFHQVANARDRETRQLLGDFHHPFVLAVPRDDTRPLGRVSRGIELIQRLAATPGAPPILDMDTSGFQNMVRRNQNVQIGARLRTRNDASVALLRLQAIAAAATVQTTHAESRPEDADGRAALRVELTPEALAALRGAVLTQDLSTAKIELDELADEVRMSARVLTLELRRRLWSIRSRLGVVERFKARCQWHDRGRLRRLADEAAAASHSPEHALRDEMNRYLFDQGLNPFAEARLGTSSRADSFDPSGSDSLYVEAKQYANKAGIESALRGAFRQALDTVGNTPGSGYELNEAFIVLFRRGGPRAVLPREPFSADGLSWYFVLINIAEPAKDASQNKQDAVEYTAQQLRNMLFDMKTSASDPGAGSPPPAPAGS